MKMVKYRAIHTIYVYYLSSVRFFPRRQSLTVVLIRCIHTHEFIYRYYILTSSRAQITTFIASHRKLCGHRVFFTIRKPYAIIRIGIICILYYVFKPNNAARDENKILSCTLSHYLRTITDATLCYRTAIYKTGRLVLRSVYNLNKFRFDNVAQRKRQ